jgi:hypothetical protein
MINSTKFYLDEYQRKISNLKNILKSEYGKTNKPLSKKKIKEIKEAISILENRYNELISNEIKNI